jgi:hypothetical protein
MHPERTVRHSPTEYIMSQSVDLTCKQQAQTNFLLIFLLRLACYSTKTNMLASSNDTSSDFFWSRYVRDDKPTISTPKKNELTIKTWYVILPVVRASAPERPPSARPLARPAAPPLLHPIFLSPSISFHETLRVGRRHRHPSTIPVLCPLTVSVNPHPVPLNAIPPPPLPSPLPHLLDTPSRPWLDEAKHQARVWGAHAAATVTIQDEGAHATVHDEGTRAADTAAIHNTWRPRHCYRFSQWFHSLFSSPGEAKHIRILSPRARNRQDIDFILLFPSLVIRESDGGARVFELGWGFRFSHNLQHIEENCSSNQLCFP